MRKIKLTLLILIISVLAVKAQLLTDKEYYIKLDVDSSKVRLIKSYVKGGAFVISYQCKCYIEGKNLEFYFDPKLKYSKVLIEGTMPETVTLSEFGGIANDAWNDMKQLNNGHLFLLEKVDENHYIKYNVIFYEASHPE